MTELGKLVTEKETLVSDTKENLDTLDRKIKAREDENHLKKATSGLPFPLLLLSLILLSFFITFFVFSFLSVSVKALHPYTATKDDELSFSEGDLLTVTKKDPDGWWEAEFNGQQGLIPGNYVEEIKVTKGLSTRLTDIQGVQAQSPISGLKNTKDCPLKEAIEIIQKNCSDLQNENMEGPLLLATMAAEALPSNPHELTHDEIAAIHIYTQEIPFYRVLNERLRSEKRNLLVPFFPYLKLFLRAIYRLPVVKCPVYRGVKLDLGGNFVEGKRYIWWGMSSTAAKIGVRRIDFPSSLFRFLSPFLS